MQLSESKGDFTTALTEWITPEDPPFDKVKWFSLILLCLSITGPIYCYAFLQPLETQIESRFNIDDTQYNYLYTLAGIPSIFMPFVGGYLADFFGARTTYLATMILIIFSQILMAYSCKLGSFGLLILGSLIYNSVFDTFYLSRIKLIITLFYNKNVTLAIGVATITQKLTMFTSNILTPWVYDTTNSLEASWWYLPVTISVFAFTLGLAFVVIDRRFGLTENLIPNSKDTEEEKVKWSDVRKLNKLVWLFMFAGALCYSGYIGILDNLNALLERRYNFNTQKAGDMASSYAIVTIFMTLLFSFLVEKTQKKMHLIMFFAICINLIFGSFLILPTCDQCYVSLVPLSLIGCFAAAFLLSSGSFPAFLVQKELLGTLYGVSAVITNTLSLIGPYLFGFILDSTEKNGVYDYTPIFIVLQGISMIGLTMALILGYFNAKMGYPLNANKPEENQRIWIR